MKKLIVLIPAWFSVWIASAQTKPPPDQKEVTTVKSLLRNKSTEALKQSSFELIIQEVKLSVSPEDISIKSVVVDLSETNGAPFGTESIVVEGGELAPYAGKRKSISGPNPYDSRIELRFLDPATGWQSAILRNAESVAMVVERSKLHSLADSLYQLDISTTLGGLYKLCPAEPFREQPVIGIGTAFVVGENTMMTAAHVFEGNLHDYAIIFGFEMARQTGVSEHIIHGRNIFFPMETIGLQHDLDLLLFQVDRPLNSKPLLLSAAGNPEKGTPVYMIGHPTGLPKKVALNASVLSAPDPAFFYTTLDSFQGNSGSPVFDLVSNKVIGVLVSGMIDYKWNGTCNYSAICKPPYCLGEKVIRLTGFFENPENLTIDSVEVRSGRH